MNQKKFDNKFNEDGIFHYNKDGFDITLCGIIYSVKWSQIKKLTAYKVDVFTTDAICIDIVLADNILTVSEETEGWHQFIEKFTVALPSINEKWEDEITRVPFQADETVIYELANIEISGSTNFYSIIYGKLPEDVCNLFEKEGWHIRKSAWDEFELQNSWSELQLQNSNGDVLLNGAVIYTVSSVNELQRIFDLLEAGYQFEFYNENKELLKEVKRKLKN